MNRILLYVLMLLFFYAGVSSATRAQECTIYTIPSPMGINWKSPRGLMFSYISNILCTSRYKKEKHPIGHMMVELKDSSRHALVGVSNVQGSGMTNKVLLKGYGLGIMFAVIDGTLEDSVINQPQVEQRCENGDIAFITYKINAPAFDRMWQYLQEYKQKGYHLFYNGENKPREGLGAGCSAFAISFLEVGGLTGALPQDEWSVRVRVPQQLIGGAHPVQLIKLLFARRWVTNPQLPGTDLLRFEPTLLFDWIVKKHSSAGMEHIARVKRGKAPGLLVDCRNILPPDEPIWKD